METKLTMIGEARNVAAWLAMKATEAGRKCFVVGVSGGVDSALVSTLCAKTGYPTLCLTLPCRSRADGLERANKHVAWLMKEFKNVEKVNIDLTATYNAFANTLNGEWNSKLAHANTKSRLRMIALYQVATCVNGLVVGTGNKVEDFGVGFFTKYGDGGVDLSPISDFLKSEVRYMAEALGVLPEIVNAIPTDGLWADTRTDETQLGATYDELEWAMQWLEDGKNCYSTVLVEGLTPRQKEVLRIYNERHTASRHKMNPIPCYKRQ